MILVRSDRCERSLWEDECLEVIVARVFCNVCVRFRREVDDMEPWLVPMHGIEDYLRDKPECHRD